MEYTLLWKMCIWDVENNCDIVLVTSHLHESKHFDMSISLFTRFYDEEWLIEQMISYMRSIFIYSKRRCNSGTMLQISTKGLWI